MALLNAMTNAFSAMNGFKQGFDVVSNNISNVNSVGFKSSKMNYLPAFSTLLQRSTPSDPNKAGGSNTIAMQVGNGMEIAGTTTKFTQGAIERTEQETDLAIYGNGFFKVVDSLNNEAYLTRAGNFRLDDRHYLATQTSGFRLQGVQYDSTHMPAYKVEYDDTLNKLSFKKVEVNQPVNPGTIGDIRIQFSYTDADLVAAVANHTGGKLYMDASVNDAIANGNLTREEVLREAPQLNNFVVKDDGQVHFTFNDTEGTSVIGGRVLVTNVADPQALVHEGNGFFSGLNAAGAYAFDETASGSGNNGIGTVRSKVLEVSNVDLTQQFSDIITLQRGFQASARVITISDEILNEVINLKH